MKKLTLFMSALLISAMSFAQVVTFIPSDFEGMGTTSTGSPVEVTKDGVTFTCDKGYGTKYALRCYAEGVVTITANKTIASLEFAYDTYKDRYYNGGLETSYTVGNNTWTVTLESQARFTSIKVTLGEGGATTPDDEPTVDPEEPETPAEVVTIADGLALADNATCVLNPFTVVYVANQYVYIEDESAYALLFKYDSGLKAGDKVTGMEVTKTTYADIAQFKPVSMEGLTIVAGPAPAIDEITTAPTVADNHLVKLVNVKLAGAIVANATVVATCSDNTTINIYSKSDFAIEDGKAYNIIGGVTQYKGVIQIQAYEVEEYVKVESGVEDVIVNEKMTKVIKNGQMYIIRDGKAYNVLGAQL